MSFTQAILEALESLNGNKMRSGLTVLGIVIGVAAVIAMLAIGNGAQASITGSISSIGTNLLFVFSGSPQQGGPPAATAEAVIMIVRSHWQMRMQLPTRSPRLRSKWLRRPFKEAEP